MLTASARPATARPPAFQAPAPSRPPATEKPQAAVIEKPEPESPGTSGDLRQDLYQALCRAGLEHSADAIQHCEVSMNGQEISIRAPKSMLLLLKDPSVERVAAQLAGKPVRVRLEAGEVNAASPLTPAETRPSPDSELRERALSHPGVKRFQELFPGAQVRTVRNLNE
jgi:DNA polymerase III subunit gamma/tau